MSEKNCEICGKQLTGKQRVVCGDSACRLTKARSYNLKYRERFPEKFKAAVRSSYQKRMLSRAPKPCKYCGELLSSHRVSVCVKCKNLRARERQRLYTANNTEKEANRKSAWYQTNKSAIYERQRARRAALRDEKQHAKEQQGTNKNDECSDAQQASVGGVN